MAIRNPAARESAVIPANISTRVVRRGSGWLRRAVYRDDRFIGYTVSRTGAHTAFDKKGEPVHGPDGDECFRYLSDAVVAVGELHVRPACKGYGVSDCGNDVKVSGGLCLDCTTARLSVQSGT